MITPQRTTTELVHLSDATLRECRQLREEAEAETLHECWMREQMDLIEQDAAMREERAREGGR